MDHVIRYVITHLWGTDGKRQLATSMQGRHTYATPEEAQRMLNAIMTNNSPTILKQLFHLPLKVMPCKCYPDHFDPIGRYFDA